MEIDAFIRERFNIKKAGYKNLFTADTGLYRGWSI